MVKHYKKALRYKGRFLSKNDAFLINAAAAKKGTGGQNFIDQYPDAVKGIIDRSISFTMSGSIFLSRINKGHFKKMQFYLNDGRGFKPVTQNQTVDAVNKFQSFVILQKSPSFSITVKLTHSGKRMWFSIPDIELYKKYLIAKRKAKK